MTNSLTQHLAQQALDGLDPAHFNPKNRVRNADSLAKIAENLLRESVADARQAGHTWDDIGHWLGITRQGAQKRFGGVS